jgi:hypothetical protein
MFVSVTKVAVTTLLARENKKHLLNVTFAQFATAPVDCIGKLALPEIMLILSNVKFPRLLKFSVTVDTAAVLSLVV